MISISRKERLTVVYYKSEYHNDLLNATMQTKWFGCVLDLIVTLEGDIDPKTGYLLDLKELKRLVRENIIDRFDQRLLNHDNEIVERGPISLELFAMEIYSRLSVKFLNSSARVKSVTLKSGADLAITYYGS